MCFELLVLTLTWCIFVDIVHSSLHVSACLQMAQYIRLSSEVWHSIHLSIYATIGLRLLPDIGCMVSGRILHIIPTR